MLLNIAMKGIFMVITFTDKKAFWLVFCTRKIFNATGFVFDNFDLSRPKNILNLNAE